MTFLRLEPEHGERGCRVRALIRDDEKGCRCPFFFALLDFGRDSTSCYNEQNSSGVRVPLSRLDSFSNCAYLEILEETGLARQILVER